MKFTTLLITSLFSLSLFAQDQAPSFPLSTMSGFGETAEQAEVKAYINAHHYCRSISYGLQTAGLIPEFKIEPVNSCDFYNGDISGAEIDCVDGFLATGLLTCETCHNRNAGPLCSHDFLDWLN